MKSLVGHKLNILKIWPTVVTNITLGNLENATEEIIGAEMKAWDFILFGIFSFGTFDPL